MAPEQGKQGAGVNLRPADFTKAVRPQVLARKNYNKIFGIGNNKTGTTTLEFVLRLYGFSMPDQKEQEARLSAQSFRTNYEPLWQFVPHYDAFQDLPFSNGDTFIAADALFPDSKFILTERDPEEWFESMCRFHEKQFGVADVKEVTEEDILERFHYLYRDYFHENVSRHLTNFYEGRRVTDWSLLYDKDYYIADYEERNNRIKKYFMDAPGKLLTIDVTHEKTTEKICDFLDIPIDLAFNMPHRNKT